MRKTLLLIGITFLSISAKSQVTFLPTNEEEYKYLSKGIKVMKEAGLDVKKGYWLNTIINGAYNLDKVDYTTEIIGLFTDDKKTIKGFSFHIKSDKIDNYIAVPVKNSALRNSLFNNMVNLSQSELYIFSMMESDLIASGKN